MFYFTNPYVSYQCDKEFVPHSIDIFAPQSIDIFAPHSIDIFAPRSIDTFGRLLVDTFAPQSIDIFAPQSIDIFAPHSIDIFARLLVDIFTPDSIDIQLSCHVLDAPRRWNYRSVSYKYVFRLVRNFRQYVWTCQVHFEIVFDYILHMNNMYTR